MDPAEGRPLIARSYSHCGAWLLSLVPHRITLPGPADGRRSADAARPASRLGHHRADALDQPRGSGGCLAGSRAARSCRRDLELPAVSDATSTGHAAQRLADLRLQQWADRGDQLGVRTDRATPGVPIGHDPRDRVPRLGVAERPLKHAIEHRDVLLRRRLLRLRCRVRDGRTACALFCSAPGARQANCGIAARLDIRRPCPCARPSSSGRSGWHWLLQEYCAASSERKRHDCSLWVRRSSRRRRPRGGSRPQRRRRRGRGK
jgi:hypothetical protein